MNNFEIDYLKHRLVYYMDKFIKKSSDKQKSYFSSYINKLQNKYKDECETRVMYNIIYNIYDKNKINISNMICNSIDFITSKIFITELLQFLDFNYDLELKIKNLENNILRLEEIINKKLNNISKDVNENTDITLEGINQVQINFEKLNNIV